MEPHPTLPPRGEAAVVKLSEQGREDEDGHDVRVSEMGSTPEEVRAGTSPARTDETAATFDRSEAA